MIKNQPRAMIHAVDIMSENVIVVRPDMPIRQVAHLMLRDRVGGFPVVDADDRMVGIIILADLLKMIHTATENHTIEDFYKKLPTFKKLSVASVMSENVTAISPQTSLPEILKTLIEKDIFTFPVVENEKIVGIVSRHDIMNALFSF